jgi:hypothetical protein
MATTTIIPLSFDDPDVTFAPGQSQHYHIDPGAAGDISNSAFVRVMVRPVWTSTEGGVPEGGDGTVVRAENFKAQLVGDVPNLDGTNNYRFHWDVVNESDVPAKVAMSLLVITP